MGGCVSPSQTVVPQWALYHLLALLRSEYSIVSAFGTRGPPSGRWTARIRPTGGSRFTLIRLPLC